MNRSSLLALIHGSTCLLLGLWLSAHALADSEPSHGLVVLDQILEDSGTPGGALVIGRCDQAALFYAGWHDLTQTRRVTARSRFNLGSNAKALLATTAAILVNDAHLSWDSPLSNAVNAPMAPTMTLLDLLTHHSGMP
ncbi:MAG: serine hydrolase domain-containing protein, partial [Pseudomonadota bacterium]